MKKRLNAVLPVIPALAIFAALLLRPQAAADGARTGLTLCAKTLIPALFPFMAASGLLLRLGAPQRLGARLEPLSRRLFGVGGAGSAVFILGISGGYPLGAVTAAELYRSGTIEKKEAERLLAFCDNSGPAFIVSAVGAAAFGSVRAGFFLYFIHALAAALTGALLRPRDGVKSENAPAAAAMAFPQAFTESVRAATGTMVTVCGFAVFFNVLVGLLDADGGLFLLIGGISSHFGAELHFTRALLYGLLELGTGAGALQGLAANAGNLALAAFLLGWGGLSVHAQAVAAALQGGLDPARHELGKLAHGLVSALLVLVFYPLFL